MLYSCSMDRTACCFIAEFGDLTRKFTEHEHMISDMKMHGGVCKWSTFKLIKFLFWKESDRKSSNSEWFIKNFQEKRTQSKKVCMIITLNAFHFYLPEDWIKRCFERCRWSDFLFIVKFQSLWQCLIFLVFTSCGDGKIRAFDVKSGHLKQTYKGHSYVVNGMLVSFKAGLFKAKNLVRVRSRSLKGKSELRC